VSPDKFESLAKELETQNHSLFLAEGAHETVVKGYAKQMIGLANAMRSKNTVFTRYYVNATAGATSPILNQAFSRGSVKIDRDDPWGNPVVDYRALTNPVQRKVLVEVVKFYRRYHFKTSLKDLGPVETAPGPSVKSDEDLAEWISTGMGATDYHPAGTAAMMPLDLGGVVDQTLSVYGVKNLRVVDASIMPILPGANTCQPTYAIAEKVSNHPMLYIQKAISN
jgi:choline dehydrogenase